MLPDLENLENDECMSSDIEKEKIEGGKYWWSLFNLLIMVA